MTIALPERRLVEVKITSVIILIQALISMMKVSQSDEQQQLMVDGGIPHKPGSESEPSDPASTKSSIKFKAVLGVAFLGLVFILATAYPLIFPASRDAVGKQQVLKAETVISTDKKPEPPELDLEELEKILFSLNDEHTDKGKEGSKQQGLINDPVVRPMSSKPREFLVNSNKKIGQNHERKQSKQEVNQKLLNLKKLIDPTEGVNTGNIQVERKDIVEVNRPTKQAEKSQEVRIQQQSKREEEKRSSLEQRSKKQQMESQQAKSSQISQPDQKLTEKYKIHEQTEQIEEQNLKRQEKMRKQRQQQVKKAQRQIEEQKRKQQDQRKQEQRKQQQQKKIQQQQQRKIQQQQQRKRQQQQQRKRQQQQQRKRQQQQQRKIQQQQQRKRQQQQQRKIQQQQQRKRQQQQQRKRQQQQQRKIQQQQQRKRQQQQQRKRQQQQQRRKQLQQQRKPQQQQQQRRQQEQQQKKKQQNEKEKEQQQRKRKYIEQVNKQQQQLKLQVERLNYKHQQELTNHHRRKYESEKKKQFQKLKQKAMQLFEKHNRQYTDDEGKMISPPSKNQYPLDMALLFRMPQYTVPQFVWTYVEGIQRQTLFVRRCFENMKYYAAQSQFELIVINSSNYKVYLPHSTILIIERTISKLQQRMRVQAFSNLKDHFQTIQRRLIMFHILNEKGGIFVEPNVLFTQNFDWMKNISTNKYVNKGDINIQAKYIGFFDIDHGSPLEKHNKIGFLYEPQKYMIQFPSFQPYFFAALPKAQYLTELLKEYTSLLDQPSSLQQKLAKYSLNMGAIQGKDLYYQIFYICQHLVLKKKQMEIDSNNGNPLNNKFAIDYYGLFTINERYFPKKIQFTFQNHHEQKMYWNLAKYTLKELQQTTGPLSYIVCMIFEREINNRLEDASKWHKKEEIHPQSFLGKYVVMNASEPFIQKQLEKNVVNEKGKPWDNLPRIIWIFWDKGIQSSSLSNKLCVDNIKKYAKLSKFQIRQLNNSNIEQYLGKQLNTKIDKFIENGKIRTYKQTKSDFARIAIIAKYGGIYMDASYFALESLDWIINISKYPSQYIFNRYGELPGVLMLFHPHFGQPFSWKFDKEANTKNMWLSAYENNLLIAEPNQQIFWDWFDEYGRFVTRPYQESEKFMNEYGVYGDRWTSSDNVYLAAMDSIKNVIGRKQIQIRDKIKDKDYKGPKSAAEYYRIWSLSGYRGQQKFRAHTNFDNTFNAKPHNSDNLFLWRYSVDYSTGIIGKVNHMAKLYGANIKFLNAVLLKSFSSNFTSEVHPSSFFKTYLYDPSIHKINKVNSDLDLEYVKK